MHYLFRALSVAAVYLLRDLRRWRGQLGKLVESLHVSHSILRGPAWLPQTSLTEGWRVHHDPQTGLRFFEGPDGTTSWTPPARVSAPSAREVERWVCNDERCVEMPTPRPATAMTRQHASRWKDYCTISTRTTDLGQRADRAIEALHRQHKWQGYCAFPRQVVSADLPAFEVSNVFELPPARHGVIGTRNAEVEPVMPPEA